MAIPTKRPSPPAGRRVRLHPNTTTSGLLLASASGPVAIAAGAFGPLGLAPSWVVTSAIATSALLFMAGLLMVRRSQIARIAATAGIVGAILLAVPYLAGEPFTTLAALVASAGALALLWKVGAPLVGSSIHRRRPVLEGRAQGAALVGLAFWFGGVLAGVEHSTAATLIVAWPLALAGMLTVAWALQTRARRPKRALVMGLAIMAAIANAVVAWRDWWWVASGLVGVASCAAILLRPTRLGEIEEASWWEPLLGHPERLFVGTFVTLCAAGTLLLMLPLSASSGRSIGLMDAAFTATSAVCVTGLIVLDTPVDFSAFGQLVLLLLIQVGGLGIMTFSTAALWALGRRMSLRHEGAVASLLSTQDRGRLYATAKRILVMTFVTELAGAILLAAAFMAHGDGLLQAVWRGVFTSISAFCNAGFALQTDNLIPYQASPVVLHVVSVLIVIGGLSPLAVFAIPAIARRSRAPVSAQAKLSLAASAILLVLGFFFFLTFEWGHSLAGLSWVDRAHNAWFQSVTLRTAGFNSVDLVIAQPATLTLMCVWMFIGGSPGGTAGGVKTTTIAVLVASVVNAIRGQWVLDIFGKRISEQTRARAAVVVAIAAATGVAALVAIQLTQDMPTRLAAFEVVSALGTVGLSIGGTAQLDGIGKIVIIVCMFTGRVGGLTLLMFLSQRQRSSTVRRPEEAVDVG